MEEEIATLQVKLNLVDEREQLDKANRLALNEVQRQKSEIEREQQRLMKEIEVSKERFKLREQLAEKEARVEACARFENEGISVILDDGDQSNATREHIERFLQSQAELPDPPTRGNDKYTSQVIRKIPEIHQNPSTTPPISLEPQLDPSTPAYIPNTPTVPDAPAHLENVPSTNIKDDVPSIPTGTANPDLVQIQLSTIAKLLEIQDQNRLPLPEPGVFSGDPLKYTMWVKAFDTLIESRAIKPRERLHFLGKYVSGEAKEVVNGFMLLDGEDTYQKAKEMLAKQFGDPFTIATAFRRKLNEWKQIVPNDAIGLRKYADFLVQCATAMKKVSGLNVLNDIQENHKMVSKLPKWLSTRWARVVYKSKEEKKGFPAFSEFVDFLVIESNIACDPVNVKFNRNNKENKRSKGTRKPDPPHPKYTSRPSLGGLRTFATKSENNNPENPATNSCQLCKANHHLDACERFREMGIKERKKFTRDKGLCFTCLEQGHLSKQCKKQRKCDTCGKLHPTSLHGDLKENANDKNANNPSREETANSTTVNCTKACFMNDGSQMRISSMIVPVWVYHSDDPENKNLTYALLDDQSDTTFVTQKTLNSLNVSGPETTLSLSTMHADRQAIESTKIKGLVVCDYNYNMSIPLPVSFSCAVIPAKRTQIPCPEMVTQWPHLTLIATSLAPYRHDIEVGLLIGSNCSRAIMLREIVAGRDNEPYAQKTELGWGIIGNVSRSRRDLEENKREPAHVTHRSVM